LTTPDSRSMTGGNGGGTTVCDNVQTAVEATHQLALLADHLRRVLTLVDIPRLLASLGSGGRGAPVGSADRLLMSETQTSSRLSDRLNPLARIMQPSAMSFYTVWRLVRRNVVIIALVPCPIKNRK
jgi:hypothetical protein